MERQWSDSAEIAIPNKVFPKIAGIFICGILSIQN